MFTYLVTGLADSEHYNITMIFKKREKHTII